MPPKSPRMKVILRTSGSHYSDISALAAYVTVVIMYLPYKIMNRNIFQDTSWTPFTKEKWNWLHQIDASNTLENGDSVKWTAISVRIIHKLFQAELWRDKFSVMPGCDSVQHADLDSHSKSAAYNKFNLLTNLCAMDLALASAWLVSLVSVGNCPC